MTSRYKPFKLVPLVWVSHPSAPARLAYVRGQSGGPPLSPFAPARGTHIRQSSSIFQRVLLYRICMSHFAPARATHILQSTLLSYICQRVSCHHIFVTHFAPAIPHSARSPLPVEHMYVNRRCYRMFVNAHCCIVHVGASLRLRSPTQPVRSCPWNKYASIEVAIVYFPTCIFSSYIC